MFNPFDAALTAENPLKMSHLQLSTAVIIIFKVICKMCALQIILYSQECFSPASSTETFNQTFLNLTHK